MRWITLAALLCTTAAQAADVAIVQNEHTLAAFLKVRHTAAEKEPLRQHDFRAPAKHDTHRGPEYRIERIGRGEEGHAEIAEGTDGGLLPRRRRRGSRTPPLLRGRLVWNGENSDEQQRNDPNTSSARRDSHRTTPLPRNVARGLITP